MIAGPLKLEENNLVASELNQDHEWKWEKISFDLLEDIMDRIKTMPMQLYGSREDSIMWKYSKDGKFSTNSAYLLATQGQEPQS